MSSAGGRTYRRTQAQLKLQAYIYQVSDLLFLIHFRLPTSPSPQLLTQLCECESFNIFSFVFAAKGMGAKKKTAREREREKEKRPGFSCA